MNFLKSIVNNIRKNTLVKDAAKLVSSNILLYLVPFIVTPILSRLYDPFSFGEWGVFSSSYQIISCVLFLCYDFAIVKAKESEFSNICGLCFLVSTIVISFSFIIYSVGSVLKIKYFIEFQYSVQLYLLLFVTAILQICQNIANRYSKYWVMSFSSIVLGLTQALCRIFFGVFVLFSNGLIVGTITSYFVGVIFLIFCLYKTISENCFEGICLSKMKRVAVEYKKFPLYDAPATLLLFCTFNLSLLILSNNYSKSEIGCLSVIHQMLLLPISLIGSALGRVYYRQITDNSNSYDVSVKEISSKMIKYVLVLSLLPAFFIVLGGDYLINGFLGDKWNNAGNIAVCMVIWSIPNILTQPLIPILRKENKQNIMLIFNIINFITSVGVLCILCYLNIDLLVVLFIYSISCAIVNYVLFLYLLRLVRVNLKAIISPYVIFLHLIVVVCIVYRVISL